MNLDLIYLFAKNILEQDTTAHDWQHALRVEQNALSLSPSDLTKEELAIIQASCWLHDTIDPKIKTANPIQLTDVQVVLEKAHATVEARNKILYIIQNLSYAKNIEQKRTLDRLGQIVQDADRLDAIGAIGIARTFYYGGSKGHRLYDDTSPRILTEMTEENYRNQDSIVNHFYEKLLVLEQTMNTPRAKEIARVRTKRMEVFLEQLFDEIGYR